MTLDKQKQRRREINAAKRQKQSDAEIKRLNRMVDALSAKLRRAEDENLELKRRYSLGCRER